MQKQLELWFQSALGRSLLADQRKQVERRIHRLFGYHQAEIGVSHRVPVGNPSNLGHKFFVLPEWEPDLPENSIISSSDELALESDTQDLVILHHALDFSASPHQTLREAARVLKSSGHLIVVGFNPYSTWGLRKLFTRSVQAPWNNRFISGRRVEDWLNLLGFKLSSPEYFYYGLPFNNVALMRRLMWLNKVLNPKLPLGAYYVIRAQKQVGAKLNNFSGWRQKAKVIGIPIANASSLNSQINERRHLSDNDKTDD